MDMEAEINSEQLGPNYFAMFKNEKKIQDMYLCIYCRPIVHSEHV